MMLDCIEWEHPEDLQDRLDSEALAIKRIDAFIAKCPEMLQSLIQTYSDEKALELFYALREEFWANLTDDDEQ
jgi:hypothetical protein